MVSFSMGSEREGREAETPEKEMPSSSSTLDLHSGGQRCLDQMPFRLFPKLSNSFLPWVTYSFNFNPYSNCYSQHFSLHTHSALQTDQLLTKPHRKPFPLSSHPSPAALVQHLGQLIAIPHTVWLFQNHRQSVYFPPHCKHLGYIPSLGNRLAGYYLWIIRR